MFTRNLRITGTGTATRIIFLFSVLAHRYRFQLRPPFVAVNKVSCNQRVSLSSNGLTPWGILSQSILKRRTVVPTYPYNSMSDSHNHTSQPTHKIKVPHPKYRTSIHYTVNQYLTVSSILYQCILKILSIIPVSTTGSYKNPVVRLFEFFTSIHNILPALISSFHTKPSRFLLASPSDKGWLSLNKGLAANNSTRTFNPVQRLW